MSLNWLKLGATLALVACGSVGVVPNGPGGSIGSYDPDRASLISNGGEFSTIYHEMGLAASGPPISFVGSVAYFASGARDTTLVVVSVSIPNRGLTFKHDQNGYFAGYVAGLSVVAGAAGGNPIRTASDSESVRVTTFKETSRTDESIIFKRVFRLAPGSYVLEYSVFDVQGQHSAASNVTLTVPLLSGSSISSLTPVYEATPRVTRSADPNLLPAPRASYVFGVDADVPIYLESYEASPVSLQLRAANGDVVWNGTVSLTSHGPGLASGIVRVPISHGDVGLVTALATHGGSLDTSRVRMFVGFGPDLPVLSFKDMLGYMRYFATASQLKPLLDATPSTRGELWAAFLKSTDPEPGTPQNEALDAYFSRIRDANIVFKNDQLGGWRSDRGSVFVALGVPSNSYEDFGTSAAAGDLLLQSSNRVRYLIWEYPQYQTRIIFYDPNDTGQWRLTRQSVAMFQSVLQRKLLRNDGH